MKPIVAIVGRPNVGKSMLFNKLIGKRLSIVEDTPGVTRDRIYGETDWNGRSFTLIDTGGIEPRTDDQILSFMRDQAQIAIENATVIIFLTDVRTGLTASDQEGANMLLRSGKPIVLAVNKMDSTGVPDPDFYEFYNLGLGDPIAVSAVHGHGTGDLLDACMEYFPPEDEEEEEDDVIKVAIIGKPNVGKSSLVNRFGLSIFYAKPNKEGFNEMAVALARRAGITPEVMTDEEICYEANRFEMRGGGLSGRTAQQFANYLLTIK